MLAPVLFYRRVCQAIIGHLFLVDCIGHYENDLAASVFFNMHIVSRSPAELCVLAIICPV